MSTFAVRHAFMYTTQLGGETGVGNPQMKSGGHFESISEEFEPMLCNMVSQWVMFV